MKNKRYLSIIVTFVLILNLFLIYNLEDSNVKVEAKAIYVDWQGHGNNTTIQAAIDAANPGDTIYVWAGTYNESIIIDKTITLIGNGTGNSTINGTGVRDTVRITADFVNISGFTIQGSGSGYYYGGIRLHRVINCTVSNNLLKNNSNGIYHSIGSGHKILNNTCINNTRGIFTYMSDSNLFKNNTIKSNQENGIYLFYSDDNTIIQNNCSQNLRSISIYSSDRNVIENNTCNSSSPADISLLSNSNLNTIANNTCNGITIEYSGSNRIFNNTIGPSGVIINGDQVQHWNQTFDLNNTMDGKSIIFWYEENNSIVPSNAGQVILINCENITIENLSFNNISTAIMLGFSKNNVIRNNTATNVSTFISLSSSNNNLIENNTYNPDNIGEIILEVDSNSNILANNSCGLITLDSSGNNTIFNNSLLSSGVSILGNLLEHWIHNFDKNNTVKGQSIFYMYNVKNSTLPIGGGQVILINCQNITVENQNFSNKGAGIVLGFSDYNKIKNNTCLNNSEPINLWNSNNNFIRDNICINTSNDGLVLSDSHNNQIIDNEFNSNALNGIRLISSDSNTITNNRCNLNQNDGIYLYRCDSNTLTDNICYLNEMNGIELYNSDMTTITNENYNSNLNHGIRLFRSSYTTISDTNCKFNTGHGVLLDDCDINTIIGNNFQNNDGNGLFNYLTEYSIIDYNNCSSNNLSGIVIEGEYIGYAHVPHGNHNTVENNTCDLNNQSGLYLFVTNNNTLINNSGSHNKAFGIQLIGDITVSNIFGTENIIFENILNSNQLDGINFDNATENLIENNIINTNTRHGIYLYGSLRDAISNNEIKNNYHSIVIRNSDICRIKNNSCLNNLDTGIFLYNSSGMQINNNNCSDNLNGFYLYKDSDSNIILNNLISQNDNFGISLVLNCKSNIIFHNNIISNTDQAYLLDSNFNTWNNNENEGNYWSDYSGLDNGINGRMKGDGIGDTDLPHLGLDSFPFVNSSGWLIPGIPMLNDPGLMSNNGTYQLTWSQTRGATAYILEEDTSETFGSSQVIYNGANTYYNVTDKIENVYYYRVRAYNDEYIGTWSNIENITINYPPKAPTNLQVAAYPEGNALNLSWNLVLGDTKEYQIYYSTNDTSLWDLTAKITHPNNSFDHIGLQNDEWYYYKLFAVDQLNQSSEYSLVVHGIPTDTVSPNSPTGLKVVESTVDTIKISWNTSISNDVMGYNVYLSTSEIPVDWGEPINNESILTETLFTAKDLNEDTKYYFVVTALDEVPNESGYSGTLCGTTELGPHGPEINHSIADFEILEDSYDDTSINLFHWFKDRNHDPMTFSYGGQKNIEVTIYQNNGTVILRPKPNWSGSETLIFYANDGFKSVYDDVTITVTPVNDPPNMPQIISPTEGLIINDTTLVYFNGECTDPDILYGDTLNYKWESNISGLLGTSQTLGNKLLIAGHHEITLTVSDIGYIEKTAVVNITVLKTPKKDADGPELDDEEEDKKESEDADKLFFDIIRAVGIIIIIILIIIIFLMLRGHPRGEVEEEEKKEEESEEEEEEDTEVLPRVEPELEEEVEAEELEELAEEDLETEELEEEEIEDIEVPKDLEEESTEEQMEGETEEEFEE